MRWIVLCAVALSGCRRSAPAYELRGVVTTPAGAPVAGAVVAANRARAPGGRTTITAADGSFAFALSDEGPFALTATSDSGTAAYLPPERLVAPRRTVRLVLGDPAEGFAIAGRAVAAAKPAGDITVRAAPARDVAGDVFVTRADASGRYRLRLPRARGREWFVEARAEGGLGVPRRVREATDQALDLDVYVATPPSPDVVEDVRRSAVPLAPGDLAALDAVVGDARIVGLGEATHGAHELFELKRRIFEHLVVAKGFRAIAFEASRPEARRVNDYVVGGRGSAAEALAGLGYWTWDTEEVRALVEWMRAWNVRAKPEDAVRFFGFDMEHTALAASSVRAYLDEVDPELARSQAAALDAEERWPKLSADERRAARDAADRIAERLDARRDAWVKATGLARWRKAREDARVLAQWTEVHAADRGPGELDFDRRDAAMAENVDDVLASGEAGDKIALWAHDAHVGVELPRLVTMGERLRAKHGRSYVAVGLLFGQGSFRARAGAGDAVQEIVLGPPPDSDGTTPLARAGCSECMIDLTRLPAGAARGWFSAPHPVRDVGVRFSDEVSASSIQVLARRYDAIAFVAKTSASRPGH